MATPWPLYTSRPQRGQFIVAQANGLGPGMTHSVA